ncbi:C2H2-type domain-containing protein [Favolaschia claudopus]|uniref:C2H2-type domain-containing protein n=1 Tax=Favolaschia claudopus TaxID=2862362 RepID=A0AAW0AIE3_9AGAR
MLRNKRKQRREASQRIPCPWPGCPVRLKSHGGVTYHVNSIHRNSNAVPQAVPPAPASPHSPQLHNDPDFHEGDSPPPSPSPSPTQPSHQPRGDKHYHPFLNARPCDEHGVFLPEGAPPAPRTAAASDDWAPFEDEVQFKLADFLFRKVQMSSKNIDELLEMWALSMMKHDDCGPFRDFKDIYDTIDATAVGDAPWKCMVTEPFDTSPDAPAWAQRQYEIWYRDPEVVVSNMLDNPDLDGAFDTTPYVRVDSKGKRRWSDFMSANFAWRHCDRIYAEDASTEGAMYTPIFFGSDKTTVSVATGDVEYHPGYISIGNPHNNMRRAHRSTVMPFVFLAIPKADRKYDNDPAFRKFKKQLYHASLAAVLSSLKPGMSTPVVRRCPDGHFRRVIYDFGPFIADYPEQVLLAGIVQGWCAKCTAPSTNLDGDIRGRRTHGLTDDLMASFSGEVLWDVYGIDVDVVPFTRDFPRADIHEMLSSDLLHQVIKGSFKDHLVTWVGEYLDITYAKAEADSIMDEIDRRIAATPAFPCLRRFKQGRRFKQWTGDDSKALMKVYIPALKGLVPDEIVQAIASFLDFCYLVRREDFDEDTLDAIDEAVNTFHHRRNVFRTLGVRVDILGGSTAFSLPRQHSITHYRFGIEECGAPGGVCSSITESRHITAVKKPWRRSNRYEALSQMLLTNQRLDKLAAARADFIERGMLPPTYSPPPVDPDDNDDDDDGGPVDVMRVEGNVVLARTRERRYPRYTEDLAQYIRLPSFPILLASFLTDQLRSDSDSDSDDSMDIDASVLSTVPISVFHSAVATFYAPSDPSGVRGMRRERIRSTPSWRKHGARRDCAFAVEDQDKRGFRGMSVVRVKLFFSFNFDGVEYPCALVDWFKKVGRGPDACTGMWIVEPELRGKKRVTTVLHLDSLLRGAHLIPVFGTKHIPIGFPYYHSLDAFNAFHVNKYADHHANEIVF